MAELLVARRLQPYPAFLGQGIVQLGKLTPAFRRNTPHLTTKETICFSQTLIPTYQDTRLHNPENDKQIFTATNTTSNSRSLLFWDVTWVASQQSEDLKDNAAEDSNVIPTRKKIYTYQSAGFQGECCMLCTSCCLYTSTAHSESVRLFLSS